MEENNNARVALILSIIALVTSELIIIVPTIFMGFFSDSFTVLMVILLVGGAPLTMAIVALNIIKTAYQPRRVFVILTRIFSIVAISISGFFLFIMSIQLGLVGLLINVSV